MFKLSRISMTFNCKGLLNGLPVPAGWHTMCAFDRSMKLLKLELCENILEAMDILIEAGEWDVPGIDVPKRGEEHKWENLDGVHEIESEKMLAMTPQIIKDQTFLKPVEGWWTKYDNLN